MKCRMPTLPEACCGRRGRRVVRVVVAQPGRDILGVRSHLNDQEHAQYDDNGNEEPCEGDGLDPHVGGDDLRSLDEKWAGQGAHKGSGKDYPQSLRPAVRRVHVRGPPLEAAGPLPSPGRVSGCLRRTLGMTPPPQRSL